MGAGHDLFFGLLKALAEEHIALAIAQDVRIIDAGSDPARAATEHARPTGEGAPA
ncbi:hypothetical protein [Pseudoxanthomonas spadix]|uniref:hypothetical protein n=1 Tax=Pseudoxanthomonas spadix TaxID=415229 RepID=UPI001474B27F|nr:hypothetical protein [Pseudoxanthomonas spadix]MBP3973444.1 hypothetical protein [Pseudoxanthomonas spadix]